MTAVRCVFAAKIQLGPETLSGDHSHACAEIVYYLEGSGELTQKGRRMRYRPGYASIYQPGMEHADHPDTPGVQICVGVTGCGAEKLPTGIFKTDDSIADCVAKIACEIQDNPESSNQDRLDILAGWLVLELARITRGDKPDGNTPPNRANTLKSILDSRFNEQIDLKELAGNLYINPDYLRHVFKQSFGESPLNYLVKRRLDAACELLKQTDMPIGEIARRVGLDNVYYFSRLFRQKIGITPTAYRKKRENDKRNPIKLVSDRQL